MGYVVTATKLLKEMHDSGQVEGRISGKQIVYHAIQVCYILRPTTLARVINGC